jgi:excinuclease ABC subunit C
MRNPAAEDPTEHTDTLVTATAIPAPTAAADQQDGNEAAGDRAAPLLQGTYPTAVADTLAHLPAQPGCYLFLNAAGKVIYVGKARSLRDRVRSYFRASTSLSLKNRRLVPEIAAIDYVLVHTENEALLREFNLIKQHQPKYNVMLRDDKSYISLRITDEPYPRIETVRRKAQDGARYFGPYTSSQSVYRTLDLVKRLFPYRTCRLHIMPPDRADQPGPSDGADLEPAAALRRGTRARGTTQTLNASGQRPPQQRVRTMASPHNRACLEYHIHRCAGPCIDAISQEAYGKMIDQAALFLQGKSEQVLTQLKQAMEEAAEQLDFERAARLRDQIEAVRRVTERQRVTTMNTHDQDVVGLARADDESCIELITVREGRMLGHRQFVLKNTAGQEDAEVVRAFVAQFYLEAGEWPDEILLPCPPEDEEALAQLLSAERGRKVALTAPKRGDKAAMVEMANKNAADAAEQRRLQWLNDTQKTTQALAELQQALQLPRLPMRMECYDISTFQGTNTVGSMVVFEGGKPRTDAYRRFHIKTVTGTDDFASMAEMVRRRMRRAGAGETTDPAGERADGAAEPGGEDWTRRPDLMIIDGGKGQLHAALTVLRELGVEDQPIISLAKQLEEVFLPGRTESIRLPATSQALFLLQRIRDEAHRFAITFHRSVRGKRSVESSLDGVPGIGSKRKRDLLRRFGSVAALRRASLEEIAGIPGIGEKTALAIKDHLGEA